MNEANQSRRKGDNDNERLFFIKRSSWLVMKRMALRSVVLFLFTLVGFWVADSLVESARFGTLPIVRRFPDFIAMMTAAAKLTFILMSLFWVRFSTQPKHDVQETMSAATKEPMAAAIVHATNTAQHLAYIGVFLYLMG
jgi:hypothetical protein